jgi:hypothetical protein
VPDESWQIIRISSVPQAQILSVVVPGRTFLAGRAPKGGIFGALRRGQPRMSTVV